MQELYISGIGDAIGDSGFGRQMKLRSSWVSKISQPKE